jgi:hypothetical protein
MADTDHGLKMKFRHESAPDHADAQGFQGKGF